MRTLIKNALIYRTDIRSFRRGAILVCDGEIAAISNDADAPADAVIDAENACVLPGLVDAHTHGRVGGDFNTADAFTSDYVVYGADGAEVVTLKDVPMVTGVSLPVKGINLTCTSIAGDAVLFDDYKLYTTGVATDFELYDFKSGLQVTEMDKARDAATVYRLSWMNATSTEKVYSVVAAYYEGETLLEEKVVKEVKMAPNTDAIEIATVEVEAGKSVRVYLRNDNKAEEPDTNVGGDTSEKPASSNLIIIIVVAVVAVLAVAGVVVLLVVMKKKKATATAAETAEDAEIAAIAEAVEEATSVEETAEETTEEAQEETNEE